MTQDTRADDVTTAEEFETALGDLLRAAADSGIDPRGSWVYRGDADDWEVMVYELDDAAAE